MSIENLLYEMERHCNNYFNPKNDPNNPDREYPGAFVELAGRIDKFLNDEKESKSSITSFSEGAMSISRDIQNNSWQKLFAAELAIYKRAKFI